MRQPLRPWLVGLVAVAAALVGCGAPTETVISDLPPTSAGESLPEDGAVVDDTTAHDQVDDSAPEGSEAPAGGPGALGVDGAFDAETGRPLRLLVRAVDSTEWFWVDSQTGAYIAPGTEPTAREFDPANVVGAQAEVAPNCEDEGSGLHVRLSLPTVQKSGRYIGAEAVYRNTDCSGEPFAWRAVAVDRDSGAADVRFRVGDGATAVTQLDYDPTGTWLLIGLADGSVEWQGGSGRVELDVTGPAGEAVQVTEVSWGTRPPVGPIPGRAFVPTVFPTGERQEGFPGSTDELVHGGEVWAVVLEASSEAGAVQRAVAAANDAGYTTDGTTCDLGAAEAFGHTGAATAESLIFTVSVYFSTQNDARLAHSLFEQRGRAAVVAQITTLCLD